jgi:hypothetical protein
MARRNNLTLEEVVDKANGILARSTCKADERKGVIVLVNSLLMDCDNYGGFRYLDATEVPPGQEPGIIPGYNDAGERDNTKNKYPDETRVQFLIKKRNEKNEKAARAKLDNEFPIFFLMELPDTPDRNGNPSTIIGRHSVRDTHEENEVIAATRRIYPNAVQTQRSEKRPA